MGHGTTMYPLTILYFITVDIGNSFVIIFRNYVLEKPNEPEFKPKLSTETKKVMFQIKKRYFLTVRYIFCMSPIFILVRQNIIMIIIRHFQNYFHYLSQQ